MFRSKHVDVKRHSVCFPEIEKNISVSSLVLNLFASQIGEFFLPHPVDAYFLLWPFILSFGDILALFIRRIMLSFPLLASLFFCLSFYRFSSCMAFFLSFSFSFLQSRVLFFLSLVLFLFLFSVLFLLVSENIYRTLSFVTCENCYRKHTETARKKVPVL